MLTLEQFYSWNSKLCMEWCCHKKWIEGNCPLPPFRIGVWVKVRVNFRVGGQPDNSPKENCPLVRVWVRVSFSVGRQFSSGAIVLELLFKWASVKSVKTACVYIVFIFSWFQILWSKHFFRNNAVLFNS